MKISFVLFIFLLSASNCVSQQKSNPFGKYVKPNNIYPQLNESIVLKEDKTFEYFRKEAFTEFKVGGYWHIQDGYLLLNSLDSNSKNIKVVEGMNKNIHTDSILLTIQYFDGTKPHCTIVVNEGDSEAQAKFTDFFGTMSLADQSKVQQKWKSSQGIVPVVGDGKKYVIELLIKNKRRGYSYANPESILEYYDINNQELVTINKILKMLDSELNFSVNSIEMKCEEE